MKYRSKFDENVTGNSLFNYKLHLLRLSVLFTSAGWYYRATFDFGPLFDVHMSVHRKYISELQPKKVQRFLDLFISIN
jgi:hypothetical protein